MDSEQPPDASKPVPRREVSRRNFVLKIVGGTGAALPGMTVIGSVMSGTTAKAAGTIDVLATADATLSQKLSSIPLGAEPSLRATHDGTFREEVVVAFLPAQIQAARDAMVGPYRVHLVLFVEAANPPLPIEAYGRFGGFNEGTVTWDNDAVGDMGPVGASLPLPGGYISWDVTSDVENAIASWRLRSIFPPEGGAQFTSRNSVLMPPQVWPMLRVVPEGEEPVPSPSPTPPSSSPAPSPSPSSLPMPSASSPPFTSAPPPSLSLPPRSSNPAFTPTPFNSQSSTPTPTATPTPTPTPSNTPAPTPSASVPPTPTPTPSASVQPTPTPTPSASARPTPTPTPRPSATPTPTKPRHTPKPSHKPKPSHPPKPSRKPDKPGRDDWRDRHNRDRRDRDHRDGKKDDKNDKRDRDR